MIRKTTIQFFKKFYIDAFFFLLMLWNFQSNIYFHLFSELWKFFISFICAVNSGPNRFKLLPLKKYIYCFYDEFLTDISVNYENNKNLILKCIRTCLWHQLVPILGMVNCISHCKETNKCKCMHNIYNWMGGWVCMINWTS